MWSARPESESYIRIVGSWEPSKNSQTIHPKVYHLCLAYLPGTIPSGDNDSALPLASSWKAMAEDMGV